MKMLHLSNTPVRDFGQLKGMPLENLFIPVPGRHPLAVSETRNLDVLRENKNLKINNKHAAQFWKEYDAKKKAKK